MRSLKCSLEDMSMLAGRCYTVVAAVLLYVANEILCIYGDL